MIMVLSKNIFFQYYYRSIGLTLLLFVTLSLFIIFAYFLKNKFFAASFAFDYSHSKVINLSTIAIVYWED
jgi:hypothetical protein